MPSKMARSVSTDATSALIRPERSPEAQRQACKKAHFFTAVVDTDYVLFAYSEFAVILAVLLRAGLPRGTHP
jgi:hypothetical protein